MRPGTPLPISTKTDTLLQQETQAALALVNANKTLAPPTDPSKPPDQEQRHHHQAASPQGIMTWTASAKFDKFGRRILTPPITRSNSSQGPISGTSTPRGESLVRPTSSHPSRRPFYTET